VHTQAGLVQDSVYKYFQTVDFIHSGMNEFWIHNHDYAFDPNNEFGIFRPPFGYMIDDKLFITFPWSWVAINAPIIKIFGFWGVYIIPFFSGLLSIISLRSFLNQIMKNETIVKLSILFYLFCTSLIIYSVWYYEGTLCNLLLFLFLNLQFVMEESKSHLRKVLWIAISILILSLLVVLRTEVFFLAVLLYGAMISDSILNLRKKFLVVLVYGLIPITIFLFSNYQIWHHPQGLRFLVTHDFTIWDRIFRIFEYFVLEKYSFLFYLPTFYLTFRLFKDWKILYSELFFRIYLACLVFIIAIPIVSPQQQGSDIMPRFYFPILPILALTIFYCIDRYFMSRKKLLTRLVFIQSALFLIVTILVYVVFNHRMDRLYKKLVPYIGETNLVSNELHGQLIQNAENRNLYLVNTDATLSLFQNKIDKDKMKNYHLFVWSPDIKNYSQAFLEKNYIYVTKIEDILIYKNRNN
jgi:hypothetical protein